MWCAACPTTRSARLRGWRIGRIAARGPGCYRSRGRSSADTTNAAAALLAARPAQRSPRRRRKIEGVGVVERAREGSGKAEESHAGHVVFVSDLPIPPVSVDEPAARIGDVRRDVADPVL